LITCTKDNVDQKNKRKKKRSNKKKKKMSEEENLDIFMEDKNTPATNDEVDFV
jgi:hypothetical protein